MPDPSSSDLIHLPFEGDDVVLLEYDNWLYSSVSNLCTNINVVEARQQVEQIIAEIDVYGDRIVFLQRDDHDGKIILLPEMKRLVRQRGAVSPELFLRRDMVPIWLASINTARLRPEDGKRLALYKRDLAAKIEAYDFGRTRSGRGPRGVRPPRLIARPLPFYMNLDGTDDHRFPFTPIEEFAIWATSDPVDQRVIANLRYSEKYRNPKKRAENARNAKIAEWERWIHKEVHVEIDEFWKAGDYQNAWKRYLLALGQVHKSVLVNFETDANLRRFDYSETALDQADEMIAIAWNGRWIRHPGFVPIQWTDFHVRDLPGLQRGVREQLAIWTPQRHIRIR